MTIARRNSAPLSVLALLAFACGSGSDGEDAGPRLEINAGVDVDVLGGASVLIDGQVVGTLERDLVGAAGTFPVTRGEHDVEIVGAKYPGDPRTVTIEEGDEKVILVAEVLTRRDDEGKTEAFVVLNLPGQNRGPRSD